MDRGWTYTLNGNRSSQSGAAPTSYNYTSSSNRLSTLDGVSIITDPAGNITNGGNGVTFIYGPRNRMVSSTNAQGTTTYSYNALGERVKKSGPGGTVIFTYDEDGQLIGEYTGTGNLIQEIVWLEGLPIASLRPAAGGGIEIFNISSDHLGTPRVIRRAADGVMVWRWDIDPFGVASPNENPSGAGEFKFNLRFPGQYADAETGLNYNYFRDYNPKTGRYVQSDPIGLKGGINTFTYANSTPVSAVDPTGLAIWMCTRKVSGFPFTGNHAYLWNDTHKTSCGMQGSFGLGPLGTGEKGPLVDTCLKIPRSDEKEESVMQCCQRNANNGLWFPAVNDCHNAAKDCLTENKLTVPLYPGRDGPLRGERRCTRAGCLTPKWE